MLTHAKDPTIAIMESLRSSLGDRGEAYTFPPPVFAAMKGEFVELDPEARSLTAQFPVLEGYMNPYGTMQGGMVAAAVDNTLGPLSVLVAPPSVTRQLKMTYSRPVTMETGHIVVVAKLLERKGRLLFFSADVRSRQGVRMARANAVHWIREQG